MAKPIEVDLQVKDNIQDSIAGLKALKRQLKDTAAGSEEFKKIYNQIDDLEDKIKSSKNASSDWIDSLESAGGPLGALGGSLNRAKVATQSFSGALKATGIGLIVALIGGLVAAFSDNEVAMKKIQPLLDGMKKIFQGIFRAVEPLFNTLVDLALSALPMVSQAFGVVYSSVTAVFDSLGMIGSAIKKLISGDFSGAWKDAKSSVNDFSKNYDASVKRFNSGTKEMTATEKEEAEKRAASRKLAQEKKEEEEKKSREKALAQAKEDAEKAIQAKKEYIDKANAFDDENNLKSVGKNTGFNRLDMEADLANKIEIQRKATEDEKKQTEARIALAKLEKEQKLEALQQTSNTLNGLADLLGKQTTAGKVAAVASATIETFLSAQRAYSATVGIPIVGPVLAPINAGLAIAGGLKNIKSILAVKTPGGGGGSAPSVGGGEGGRSSASPNFNVVGASSTNQLAQSIGQQQNQPIKAYVVSNEVTTQQALDRNIVKSATLG